MATHRMPTPPSPPHSYASREHLQSRPRHKMVHSDFPESSSSQDADFVHDPPPIASISSSWSFEPSLPEPAPVDVTPRVSVFSSGISFSRLSPSSSTPALGIPGRSRSPPGDEPARTPPHHLSNLEPLSSSPEDWREQRLQDEIRATSNRRRLPRVEKDVDDPTQAESVQPVRSTSSRSQSTTRTTLSRLFAVKAATSPTDSRDHLSHNQSAPRTRKCKLT